MRLKGLRSPADLPVGFDIPDVDHEKRCCSGVVRLAVVRLTLQHGVAPRRVGTTTDLVIDGPSPIVLGDAPLARIVLGRLVR